MTRSIILQYGTSEQQALLDISVPINKKYADKFGFEHIMDGTKRCPERVIFWEKIAYLNTILPTIEDGSLLVYMDGDSLAIGDVDLHAILPTNGVFGMVQLRGGLGGRQLIPWFNAGLIAMIVDSGVRSFFTNVWNRNTPTDEDAINDELKHCNSIVTDGKAISSLDIKWNCWKNNIGLCSSPVIRSFHGMKFEDKLIAMTNFLKS